VRENEGRRRCREGVWKRSKINKKHIKNKE
jgi:hypothetical protein